MEVPSSMAERGTEETESIDVDFDPRLGILLEFVGEIGFDRVAALMNRSIFADDFGFGSEQRGNGFGIAGVVGLRKSIDDAANGHLVGRFGPPPIVCWRRFSFAAAVFVGAASAGWLASLAICVGGVASLAAAERPTCAMAIAAKRPTHD